jgi:hypothetical protein
MFRKVFLLILIQSLNFTMVYAQNGIGIGQPSNEPSPGVNPDNGRAQRSVSNLGETGSWNGLYLKFRLTDQIFYYSEHHYRRRNSLDNLYDFVGRMRQLYNRWGINFLFNKHFEFTIGPTLVWNYTPRPGDDNYERVTLEPRIWHQWIFIMPPMGRAKIYHQFRFEHRWKRDNDIGAEFEYTNRYRYKLFSYIPINKPYLGTRTWFFAPSAEIFLHSGKSIVYHPFEDFRIYTGLGYIFNENFTFFGGHMWTMGQTPKGFEYRESHIIRLNLFVNFDFRGPKQSIPKIHLMD